MCTTLRITAAIYMWSDDEAIIISTENEQYPTRWLQYRDQCIHYNIIQISVSSTRAPPCGCSACHVTDAISRRDTISRRRAWLGPGRSDAACRTGAMAALCQSSALWREYRGCCGRVASGAAIVSFSAAMPAYGTPTWGSLAGLGHCPEGPFRLRPLPADKGWQGTTQSAN